MNGFVCAPEPAAIAEAISQLARDRATARPRWATPATSGRARITWDGVIEKLVALTCQTPTARLGRVDDRVTKLIIQIPCLNEAADAAGDAAPICRVSIPGIDVIEMLVIDDGSRDGTADVARAHGVDHVVRFRRNKGLAAAFMAGIDAALKLGADFIVNTDADNQYAGERHRRAGRAAARGEADIVHRRSQHRRRSRTCRASKKLLQRLGSWVVRQVSGTKVPDTTSGFRAYTREAALRMTIVSEFSYTLESIIQAGKKRMAIAHVEVAHQPAHAASRGCSTASSRTSSGRRRRSCASTRCTSR